jgi:hypothetical protein
VNAVFICAGGCGRKVTGIYCETHREEYHRIAREAREAASQRMADPEFQARLQAARAAKRQPAREGA